MTLLRVFLVLLASPQQRALYPFTMQPLRSCPSPDRGMEDFIAFVRLNVKRPANDRWHGLDFSPADTVTIRPVTDAAICDRALTTISAFLAEPKARPVEVRVVHVGNYYVAGATRKENMMGEFTPSYILDETLTTVLFPCRNGTAHC